MQTDSVYLWKKVIQEVIRSYLQFDGTVITDDISMDALDNYKGGREQLIIDMLNAGVDYILLANDMNAVDILIDTIATSSSLIIVN